MSTWFAQHFFNPSLIWPWGAGLVALPIVIHLINRMRFRRVRFAAMEFLLQSQKRNQRRFLLEQLLLLALRVLLVLLVLALLGRLILDPDQLSVFRGAKSHHLVLIDDSGSMRDRWGDTSAFKEALEAAKKLVAEGTRRPDTQQLTLMFLSDPERPLFVQRDVNENLLTELETKLENVRCSHRRLDLAAGLEAARKYLADDRATIRSVHVISDYRLADWNNQKVVASAVHALDEAGIAVNLVKTAPERHQNLAVTDLAGDVQVAAVAVPLRLRATIHNFNEDVAQDVRLSVLSDGNKLPLSIVFNKIEPGADIVKEFDVVFNRPGKHTVEVSLEQDALSDDNSRFLVADIANTHPILIVDGDPLAVEATYVADALAASPGLTGFAPLVESVDYLRKHPLEQFQCIYLINVPELPADAIEPLEEYVRGGGGLAWFLGELVKPAFYNEALYANGKGLFPVPLAPARSELVRDATNPGPDLQFANHPVFSIFEGQNNPFVQSVTVETWNPTAETWNRDDNQRKDGVATICTLKNRQPLMFEHAFGKGRVITSLTTAGPAWNAWPRNPSYVIFQLELEKHLARDEHLFDRRIVGEEIHLDLDPAVYSETVEVVSPDATGERIVRLKAAPPAETPNSQQPNADKRERTGAARAPAPAANPEDLTLAAHFRDTDLPGVYKVKLVDHNQLVEERWFAYNVPGEEGDLALVSTSQMRSQLGDNTQVQIQEAGSLEWIQGEDAGQEVRSVILMLLIGLLLVEQLLAFRLSYHPPRAEAA